MRFLLDDRCVLVEWNEKRLQLSESGCSINIRKTRVKRNKACLQRIHTSIWVCAYPRTHTSTSIIQTNGNKNGNKNGLKTCAHEKRNVRVRPKRFQSFGSSKITLARWNVDRSNYARYGYQLPQSLQRIFYELISLTRIITPAYERDVRV